jgi:N-acetyl-anhydromuramyl-L-alanine amidase AmpD
LGSKYLTDLADVLRDAGLQVFEESGWETRARSSGGYDDGPIGITVHHTASNTSRTNDVNYMTYNADARPIANLLLDRDGAITVMAAGATNTAGKGGPYEVSAGTIPLDSANSRTIGFEAANEGTGEPWPEIQQTSYLIAVEALCDAYGLDAERDVFGHFEWSPGRKYDPAGESRWATDADLWDMDAFRADVADTDEGGVMPDEQTVKRWVREVLDEGTAFGQTSWASTSAATLGGVQDLHNQLQGIKNTLAVIEAAVVPPEHDEEVSDEQSRTRRTGRA